MTKVATSGKIKTRKEHTVSGRSNVTNEVYKRIFTSYSEMNKWAEKNDLVIFNVVTKVIK